MPAEANLGVGGGGRAGSFVVEYHGVQTARDSPAWFASAAKAGAQVRVTHS